MFESAEREGYARQVAGAEGVCLASAMANGTGEPSAPKQTRAIDKLSDFKLPYLHNDSRAHARLGIGGRTGH